MYTVLICLELFLVRSEVVFPTFAFLSADPHCSFSFSSVLLFIAYRLYLRRIKDRPVSVLMLNE